MALVKSMFNDKHYNIYLTLEPILYRASLFLQSEYEEEIYNILLSDLRCGFKNDKAESITRLVCANINNITIEEFFSKHRECTNIGGKIASNLIRVATQRIYSDPYRSFIEPVVNSIDAYNEMEGKGVTTGKFGMGFFSLLYWLLSNGSSMQIHSSYREDNYICSWVASITFNDGNFYFRLLDSYILTGGFTGTKIIFQFNENGPINAELFDAVIYNTFSLVPNFVILDNNKLVNVGNEGPRININHRSNYIFDDKATGMSISTLLTKLLVPSISTKTIAKSLSVELTYSGPKSEANMIPLSDVNEYVRDKNYVSQFFVNIRGISIYSESLTEKEMSTLYSRDSNAEGDFIREQKKMYTHFILSLPDQTPLPVSRDDIIITDSIFYEATKQNLISLLHSCIDKNIDLDNLLIHLQNYANYANDNSVYSLVGEVTDYLYSLENIYLVPKHYHYFYSKIIRPMTDKQYVGISNAPLTRLTGHIMNIEDLTKVKRFTNRIVLIVENMKKLINVEYTTGGLISVIFVDSLFVNRKDWASFLMSNMRGFLYDGRIEVSDEITSLIAKDKEMVNEYMNRYADLIELYASRERVYYTNESSVEVMYNYISKLTRMLALLSNNRQFLDRAFDMIYSSFYKCSYRNVSNSSGENNTRITAIIRIPNKAHDRGKYFDDNFRLFGVLEKKPFDNVNEKYLLEHLWIFLDVISSSKRSQVNVLNPIVFSCFNASIIILNPKDEKQYSAYISKVQIYLYDDKPVVYNVVYSLLNMQIYKYTNKGTENVKKYLDYIYKELSTKYGLSTITRIVKDYIADDKSEDIYILYDNLILGINLLSKTLSGENYTVIYRHIDDRKFTHTFTANQLINYLFQYDVDTNSLDWLNEVVKYKPSNAVKFQALEIAINEGTSKSFIESVLTELTQNSIDAAKGYLYGVARSGSSRIICKSKSGRSILYLDEGQIVSQIYNGDKDPVRTCVNMLELIVGKINDSYGISVIDQIGIPVPGIIAIMLPFYSTKKAGEVISTGEMGTGFMNVYRQPYCREVWIKTYIDDDSVTIKVLPILDDYNRVVDLQYNIDRQRGDLGFGTNVSILFNDKLNYTSMMSEALIYSNSFYPAIAMESYINSQRVSDEIKFLFENRIAKVYLRKDSNGSSVILTNGVPYSWLKNYLDDMSYGIRKYGSYNIIIDLKRDSYKPQQSRKRILFEENIDYEFMETIALASLLNAIEESIARNKDDQFPGMDYPGDPGQRMSDSGNFYDKVKDLICLKTKDIDSVSDVLREAYGKMVSNGIKGRLTEDVTRPYIVEATVTLRKFPIIREMFIAIAIKWFSNKNIKDEKSETEGVKEIKIDIPEDVLIFLNKVVKHNWHEAIKLIQKDDLYLFHIKDKAPQLSYSVLPLNTLGFYSPSRHSIVLNSQYYDVRILSSIERYINAYRKDKDKAARLIVTDEVLNRLIGDRSTSVTLVHEFFHSIRGESHGPDIHGKTNFTMEGLIYRDIEYDNAANTIWKRLISTFDPLV